MNKTVLFILVLAISKTNSTNVFPSVFPDMDDDCEYSHEEPNGRCCSKVKKEVCGKSGLTYLNKCFLGRNQDDKFEHEGCCHHPAPTRQCVKACTDEHKPVCGVTGKTYQNECHLTCNNNDILAYHGECNYCNKKHRKEEESKEEKECPNTYEPVCGKDGKTYDNWCMMKKNGQKFKHNGKCHEEVCFCPEIYNPVCGKDGKTYGNKCKLGCAGVEKKHKGECLVVPEKCAAILCSIDGKPVCGKTGLTYNNYCLLECAGDKLKHKGPCGKDGEHKSR